MFCRPGSCVNENPLRNQNVTQLKHIVRARKFRLKAGSARANTGA
jgi:hypothetical protein